MSRWIHGRTSGRSRGSKRNRLPLLLSSSHTRDPGNTSPYVRVASVFATPLLLRVSQRAVRRIVVLQWDVDLSKATLYCYYGSTWPQQLSKERSTSTIANAPEECRWSYGPSLFFEKRIRTPLQRIRWVSKVAETRPGLPPALLRRNFLLQKTDRAALRSRPS